MVFSLGITWKKSFSDTLVFLKFTADSCYNESAVNFKIKNTLVRVFSSIRMTVAASRTVN